MSITATELRAEINEVLEVLRSEVNKQVARSKKEPPVNTYLVIVKSDVAALIQILQNSEKALVQAYQLAQIPLLMVALERLEAQEKVRAEK